MGNIPGAQSFLLALSALFSIVNPLGSALIFSQVTADRSHAERLNIARRIGFYSALVMLGALWGGAYILAFFGVSLAALRIAGGVFVATRAWSLLQAPETTEERKQEQASHAEGADDVAFFPLTIPFTTGPGTIAVALALGSNGDVPAHVANGQALLINDYAASPLQARPPSLVAGTKRAA
jgi:multiple antibiotic resistance protein